jgi:hypothetical protein
MPAARLIILQSAAKYSLNAASLKKIMDSKADERSAFLIGLAKNAQQVIRYRLYGQTINFICDKVLTPRDVHPSDEIKVHLKFCPAIRAGWLKYIQTAYAAGHSSTAVSSIGQGALIVPDDE